MPQPYLPLVTPEGYIKTEKVAVLETRALPRRDDILPLWKIQRKNLTADQAIWEDKAFIRATFPSFYFSTLKEWSP
jgi:hypothetical protein